MPDRTKRHFRNLPWPLSVGKLDASALRKTPPAQCRAARALIGMTQAELAGSAVVPTSLIADYETGANGPRQADLDAIRAALERAGVEFIDGDRPGVWLGKRGK